jgi:tRNA(fMet)-specific endonuclease VapC
MSMSYLLDTNICIYIAKKSPENVLKKFKELKAGSVGMSNITYGELWYGIKKSQQPEKSAKILEDLSFIIEPLPLPVTASEKYADIRSSLEKQGTPIGNNDLWIAAHAISEDLILVSNNIREFSRIPNLKIENWI